MSQRADFLFEIGTEELPPKALEPLRAALVERFAKALAEHRLRYDGLHGYATPRRLAVEAQALDLVQPPRQIQRSGPPAAAAFDAQGRPTRAAEGFAQSCGVSVDRLMRRPTDKGERLFFEGEVPGQMARELLPEAIKTSIAALPVPRLMRWGRSDEAFVRPVHWLVALLGEEVLELRLFGIDAGRHSRGHRFHHPQLVRIDRPSDYRPALARAKVLVDSGERRHRIEKQIRGAADALAAEPVWSDDLIAEVTALVEWPVAVTATFEGRFLALPTEVLIATLQGHQRYFPLRAKDTGELLAQFVTIANIDSREPMAVKRGNERVVRPRLADAEFFYRQDLRRPLADWAGELSTVVFQRDLGTLGDKARRIARLAEQIAPATGAQGELARRAAILCKADLVTAMVGEFPELQGVMGEHYARAQGESEAVAVAIGEHYRPRYAGDRIAASSTGRALAIADRVDTLCGIFATGQRPTGERDPFALRRAAVGVLRTLIEGGIELELPTLLEDAAAQQPVGKPHEVVEALWNFIQDRLRSYYLEAGESPAVIAAVAAAGPSSPLDFHRRLVALRAFLQAAECEALAAAHKRCKNILRKVEHHTTEDPALELLAEPAEQALFEVLTEITPTVAASLARADYGHALQTLAQLRTPVDRFFDEVMVMVEDPALRRNRLALLSVLVAEFQRVADLSSLQQLP